MAQLPYLADRLGYSLELKLGIRRTEHLRGLGSVKSEESDSITLNNESAGDQLYIVSSENYN